MGPSIRSFIAVDLSNQARLQIEELVRELKKSDAPVGWVRVEGIHLTLKFLGNVAPEMIEEIKPVLAGIASETGPIHIEPGGCGAFPTIKAPRVIWVGLRGPLGSLAALQKKVEEAMIPFGFAPENRPFKPHLTVGRVKGRGRPRRMTDEPGDARRGALDPTGQTYEVRRLYVADGSALPSASGVNPMITIMGTAHYIAQQVKAAM